MTSQTSSITLDHGCRVNPVHGRYRQRRRRWLPAATTTRPGRARASCPSAVNPCATGDDGHAGWSARRASIVFDRNPAISTGTWSNEIDVTAPTAAMTPVPPSTTPGLLPLAWQGDDANGSGVATYTVYVSQDGGPLQPWLADTTATTASYPTLAGHRYGFAVQATDNVGNVGTLPASPQITTSVHSAGASPAAARAIGEVGADGGVSCLRRGRLPRLDRCSVPQRPSGRTDADHQW